MRKIVFVRTFILILVFVLVCTFVGCKDNSSVTSENKTSVIGEDITTSDTQDEIENTENYVPESDMQNEVVEDNADLEDTYSEEAEFENLLELTDENLLTTWEFFLGERNYYITLSKYNKMTYGCMITDTLYHLFMIDGKYSISGDEITFSYYYQGQDYIEKYKITLTDEYLFLTSIGNGATTLMGTYTDANK